MFGWSSPAAIRDSRKNRSRNRSSCASVGASNFQCDAASSARVLGDEHRAHRTFADERFDSEARHDGAGGQLSPHRSWSNHYTGAGVSSFFPSSTARTIWLEASSGDSLITVAGRSKLP